MDNNSYLLTQPKKNIKKKKSKKTKKKLGSIQTNIYPYLYLDKNWRNKSQIQQKNFNTEVNTRKNSLSNLKNNNSVSSSTKNSISKFNRSRFNSFNFISSSTQIKQKIKKNNIIGKQNNFDIDKIEIKTQENWELPHTLSKKINKSISRGKANLKKESGKFLKTENNQKLIFNNVGIHYHRVKNNKIDNDKKDLINNQEISKLKNQIFILLKKNANLESEKNEKDNKIEILEEKIDKLLNFIKDKKLSSEDSEKLALKNKINSLENNVNFLKNENSELKKEIENKNKIILALTNNQFDNNIFNNKKNKSIGKKKEKHNIKKIDFLNRLNTVNSINENDINNIKKISIDPDNF